MEFQKLKPNRIFQGVVDQIQEAVIDGRLKPGDVLPSEIKLKELFDTSRGTIREALRVLEQKGLIDIKTGVGGGAVVRSPDTAKVSESLDLLLQSQKVSFDQLAEFREGIEGTVAALAAKRASSEDIRSLKDLISDEGALLEKPGIDWQELLRMDVQVHISVAQAAGNPVYTAVLQMVHENVLGFSERFAIKDRTVLQEIYRDHVELVRAVENGWADKAKDLAEDHVRKNNRYMKASNPL